MGARGWAARVCMVCVCLCVAGLLLPAVSVRAATVRCINAPNGTMGCGVNYQATIATVLTISAGGDTIRLYPATYNELLTLNKDITLEGVGAITINGGMLFTVITVNSGITATLTNLTITGGKGTDGVAGGNFQNGSSGGGGGVNNSGTLAITGSTISGNIGGGGSGGSFGITVGNGSDGGIANGGTLTLTSSTISGNTGGGGGSGATFGNGGSGGVGGVGNGGTLTVTTGTISGNTGGAGGAAGTGGSGGSGGNGGVRVAGNFTLGGTIISGNTSTTTADVFYISGTVVDNGYNLLGTVAGYTFVGTGNVANATPKLGALRDNGGPTQTRLPLPGSPAIDTGNPAGCGATDQRGTMRPQNGRCDIGAVEYVFPNAIYVDASAAAGGDGTQATPVQKLADGLAGVATGGTVNLAAGSYAERVTLTRSVTLTGAGANTTTITGGMGGTTVTVNSGIVAGISGVTITGGSSSGIVNSGVFTLTNSAISGNTASDGGGIFTTGGGSSLTVTGSTISGNTTVGKGGGLAGGGTLTLTNSTVSGNTAGNAGGGIDFPNTLTIRASTITGNTLTASGGTSGGIFAPGVFTLGGSIIAGNTGGNLSRGNGSGTLTDEGSNLIGSLFGTGFTNGMNNNQVGTATAPLDPKLLPLANNGGPTRTHLPRPDSPALDAGGTCPMSLTSDQRGTSRAAATTGPCDIGAVEVAVDTPTLALPPSVGTAGQAVRLTGTGFRRTTALTVEGQAVPLMVAADGLSFTATLPAHAAGTVTVTVTNPGTAHTATTMLTYTTPNAAPTLPRSTVTPNATPPGAAPTTRVMPTPASGGAPTATPLPAPTRRMG